MPHPTDTLRKFGHLIARCLLGASPLGDAYANLVRVEASDQQRIEWLERHHCRLVYRDTAQCLYSVRLLCIAAQDKDPA
jgi:hypothetical protein